MQTDRRMFLAFSLATAGGLLVARGAAAQKPPDGQEALVTPGEDLMQEHGVIERILLVYEEVARRLEAGQDADLSVATGAARLVRSFVEDYHEKLEEDLVFPRLRDAGKERDTVATLLQQHERGRALTDRIAALAAGTGHAPELVVAMRSFSRMYRPHAAREDTVVFPAFRGLMTDQEYRDLGERFEDREHAVLGNHGFEEAVAQVRRLEERLDVHDLSTFTAA